jgi:hypothetical protein
MHPAFFFFLLNLWSRFAILAANGSSGRAAQHALHGANKAHGMSGAAAQCHNRVERGEDESLTGVAYLLYCALQRFRLSTRRVRLQASPSTAAPASLPAETPNANSPRTILYLLDL